MTKKISKVRNGQLDFFKFLFSIVVLLYHGRLLGSASAGDRIIFQNGLISVEFFFMVSGFFFIPSVERFFEKSSHLNKYNSVFKENIGYIGNKIKSILGLYIISVIFSFVMYTIYYVKQVTEFNIVSYIFRMSKSIWNILLLQSSVTTQLNINSVTWYISAMFIVMFILYPVVRCKKDLFVRYICPIGSILLLGVLVAEKNSFDNYDMTAIHLTKGLIRAFIGIMIGCIIYEVSNYCKEIKFTTFSKLLFSLVGYAALLYSLVLMDYHTRAILDKNYDWEVNITVIFALAVTTFVFASGLDITNKLYNNSVSSFLGKLSTAIYLLHIPCRRIVQLYFYKGYSYNQRLLIMLVLSLAVSLIAMFVLFVLRKLSAKIKPTLKRAFLK